MKKQADNQERTAVIGIDLGTTFSVAAHYTGVSTQLINARGARLVPSEVVYAEDVKVGEAAVRFMKQAGKRATHEKNHLYHVKRLIGRRFNEPEVQQDIKEFTYKVVPHVKEEVPEEEAGCVIEVEVDGKKQLLPPEYISSLILSQLKRAAEDVLSVNVTKAVITVPAYFSSAMRSATEAAARMAGLEVLRLVNEPTAAAFSYTFNRPCDDKAHRALVFDLGGGTLDVSVVGWKGRVFDVHCSHGDLHLGGRDWDSNLEKALLAKFKEAGLSASRASRVCKQATSIKEQLSRQMEAECEVEVVEDEVISVKVTRQEFEEMNQALFDRCLEVLKETLKKGDIDVSSLEEVLLVGGSTRMPRIKAMLNEYFKGALPIRVGDDVDEAVARGAAIYAWHLSHEQIPEEEKMVVSDISSQTIGIELRGKDMHPLILVNTKLPASGQGDFGTAVPFQQAALVRVYEGPNPLTKDNKLIGQLEVKGFTPTLGQVNLRIKLDLDQNNLLHLHCVLPDQPEHDYRLEFQLAKNHQLPETEVKKWKCTTELHAVRDLINEAKELGLEEKVAEASAWYEANRDNAENLNADEADKHRRSVHELVLWKNATL